MTPDDAGVTAAVAAIRRALFEEARDMRDATGPAREEVPGMCGLGHRGVAATFFGERGGGKSTVALVLGVSAAAAGERVLYLDRENGPALTRDRVGGILEAHPSWGDPSADERFVSKHYPRLERGWSPEAFGEAITGEGFTVVIFDSVREYLAQLDIDAHRGDVSPFINLAVTPLVSRGACVFLTDNVGHQDPSRPKGDGGKLDAVPQAYKVKAEESFTPDRTGRVGIVCTRSRFGDIDREWTMRVGGGVFETPSGHSEAPDAVERTSELEATEEFRQACVGALRERSPLGRDALFSAVRERGAQGRNETLRKRLDSLVADPTSGIGHTSKGYCPTSWPQDSGPGRGHPAASPVAPGPHRDVVPEAGAGPGPGVSGGAAAAQNGHAEYGTLADAIPAVEEAPEDGAVAGLLAECDGSEDELIRRFVDAFDAVELDDGGRDDAEPRTEARGRGRRAECSVTGHGARDWRSWSGNVVCGVCHPPAAPELVAEWLPGAAS